MCLIPGVPRTYAARDCVLRRSTESPSEIAVRRNDVGRVPFDAIILTSFLFGLCKGLRVSGF